MPDYTFFTAVVDYLTRDPDPAIAHAAIRLLKVMPKPVTCTYCGAEARYHHSNSCGAGQGERWYHCPDCQLDFYETVKG